MHFPHITNSVRHCSKHLNRIHSSTKCVCSFNWQRSYVTSPQLVLGKKGNVLEAHVSSLGKSKGFCSTGPSTIISLPEYEIVCNETLESLTDYFDVILEDNTHLVNADVTYGDGVLTVNFGSPHGTYVINRQTPNKQIWLSSPTSGPKRYDFDPGSNTWIYRHDNKSLHDLLQEEIVKVVQSEINFHQNCSHSGKTS